MSNLTPTKNSVSARYIEQALKEHQQVILNFRKCKEHTLKCGFFFKAAQDACAHGDFAAVLLKYDDQISARTVYSYIQFAAEVTEWVRLEQPQIEGDENILAAGIKMVLQSPKGYIALMRQLGEMRKFGEYDEVKYRAKKLLGNGKPQMEFSFDELAASADVFAKIGSENFFLKYPEGKDEEEALGELEIKLETALNRVREIKKNGRIIEA